MPTIQGILDTGEASIIIGVNPLAIRRNAWYFISDGTGPSFHLYESA